MYRIVQQRAMKLLVTVQVQDDKSDRHATRPVHTARYLGLAAKYPLD